jgi:hypothetical protein
MCESNYGRTLPRMPLFHNSASWSNSANAGVGGSVLGLKFAGFDLVDITPNPRFARFDRANQGVLHFLEVLGRVFVFRRVATPYVTAGKAQAKVNPGVAHFHAFFADVRFGCFDLNLVEVRTSVVHDGVSRKYPFRVK